MGLHGIRNWMQVSQGLWQWTKTRAIVAIIIIICGAMTPLATYVIHARAAVPGKSAIYQGRPNQSQLTMYQAPRKFPPNPHPVYTKPGAFQPIQHPFTPTMKPLLTLRMG